MTATVEQMTRHTPNGRGGVYVDQPWYATCTVCGYWSDGSTTQADAHRLANQHSDQCAPGRVLTQTGNTVSELLDQLGGFIAEDADTETPAETDAAYALADLIRSAVTAALATDEAIGYARTIAGAAR